ncbi:hypothetical protein CBW65_01495 [Tumebacillus avium]|uniref:Macro domain-containing protein n=1 Tax=Tumebacillus avium TaxID=1903704 RepID=A0A1Y0IHC3_9BACL|nr:macro domain-containing protein [Tumebacillus avium]ARU59877.1 hypothetical protein CBW65_01495 [Tumebacillus avium]
MITYVKTNLLESPAQVLVNTINTVGVMGKGIAKEFKTIYPDMFKEYQLLCEEKTLDIGMLWIFKTSHKWILNFPTKKHWRSPSKLEYIEQGLKKFVETYEEKGIVSISFPLLGCGNGGLNWELEVQPLMEKYLRPLPIDVYIHLNPTREHKKKEHNDVMDTKAWLRANPQELSFTELWDDLTEVISTKRDIAFVSAGEKYNVRIYSHNNEVGILFTSEHTEVFVTEEQLMDLWKYLRRVGFALKQTLPNGLEVIGSPLLSLLSNLPYLEPVSMGFRYESEDDLHLGIRIIPQLIKNDSDNGEVGVSEIEE